MRNKRSEKQILYYVRNRELQIEIRRGNAK